MPVVTTLALGYAALLCLGLAWAIGRRGKVGLIAGYRPGTLSPDDERAFAKNIERMLLLTTAALSGYILNIWTVQSRYAGPALLVFCVALVPWSFWLYARHET